MCTMVEPSSKSQAHQTLTTKRVMQGLKHTIHYLRTKLAYTYQSTSSKTLKSYELVPKKEKNGPLADINGMTMVHLQGLCPNMSEHSKCQ